MKFIIQRVSSASVEIDGQVAGSIDNGYFVLIGVTDDDTEAIADKMIRKLTGLRIFADAEGKTNLSIEDVAGSMLLVSQFTLYADCRKGNRPSFVKAGSPEHAEKIYDYIVEKCRAWADEVNRRFESEGNSDKRICIATGSFGADMKCSLVNDGPFTIDMDSAEMGF